MSKSYYSTAPRGSPIAVIGEKCGPDEPGKEIGSHSFDSVIKTALTTRPDVDPAYLIYDVYLDFMSL